MRAVGSANKAPTWGAVLTPHYLFPGDYGRQDPFWMSNHFHNLTTQRSVSYSAANTYMYLQLSHYFWIRHSKKGVKIF